MNHMNTRRARWSAIAVAIAAILGASALTAAPASADAPTISGTVLDAGTPIEGVFVEILKYNAVEEGWSNFASATTEADGTWADNSTYVDAAYALYYYVDDTAAVYSTNQGFTGEVDRDTVSPQFTVTGGVLSATSFPLTLARNAGIVQVHLTTQAGSPIKGNTHTGFGKLELTEHYSELDGFSNSGYNLEVLNAAWTGTLTLSHVEAGTYYYGTVDAADAPNPGSTDYDDYKLTYLNPITVTAETSNDFTYALAPESAPDVPELIASVSGTPKVGSPLTAVTTATTATLSYQWYAGDNPIPGASALTFTPTTHQLGSVISVRVFSNQAGYGNRFDDSADATAVVAADPIIDDTPTVIGAPDAATVTISGSPKFGGTLTATAVSPLAGAVTYQWYRNGAAITGATATTLPLGKADLGTSVFVTIRSVVAGHSDATVSSTAVAVAKEAVSLKATTDKTIRTRTVPTVKVTVKPSASKIAATAKVKVYYTKTKYKSVTVKSGKSATVKLPKLKKGKTTLKIVYPGTAYYKAKTVTIKVKVSK